MARLGDALQAIGWACLPLLLLPFLLIALPIRRDHAAALVDVIDGFHGWLGSVVRWFYPVLVVSVVFTVFALSIFGWASPKLDESAIYLHAFALMLGMAPTLMAGEHVRVDVVYERLSPGHRQLVNLVGFYVLLVPLMIAILWESQSATAFSWAILEGSPDADGIRGRFLLKTLIPVFAITMLTQGLSMASRSALVLRSSS